MSTDKSKTDDVIAEILLDLKYDCTINEKAQCNKTCSICFSEVNDSYTIELKCSHTFHRECFMKNLLDYKRTQCPNCQYTMK
jgi:hypothetical protein